MERPCSLKRASLLGRSMESIIAANRPRRSVRCVGGPTGRILCPTRCESIQTSGSYDRGLTRSQEGRRQRARQKSLSRSTPAPLWRPSESAGSRSEWLEAAKLQTTEVLLEALIDYKDIPQQRLPILLTLLEGRLDLEDALDAAGVSRLVTAVLASDILQRLLPGGILHEALLEKIVEQATNTPSVELRDAARLIAVWRPPTGGRPTASAASAVAAVMTLRVTKSSVADVAATRSGSGDSSSSRSEGGPPSVSVLAALAEGLAALRPWLEYQAAGPQPAGLDWEGGSGLLDGFQYDTDEAQSDAMDAAEALGFARAAVAALLSQATVPGLSLLADPDALSALVTVASEYSVEYPADLARVASGAAAGTSLSADFPKAEAATRLAVQLVMQACLHPSSGGSGSGSGSDRDASTLLSPDKVRLVVESRLAAQLGPEQHVGFLGPLRDELLQQLSQPRSLGSKGRKAAAAALLEALGTAAGSLQPDALVLGLECAAAVASLPGVGGSLAAATSVPALREVLRRLLGSAAAVCAALPTAAVEQCCRLGAAAVQLQRFWPGRGALRGEPGGNSSRRVAAAEEDSGESECAAAVAKILATLAAVPLDTVGVEAIALLLAAAAPAGRSDVGAGADLASEPLNGRRIGLGSTLPPDLLDALLDRLAEVATPADDSGEDGAEGAAEAAQAVEAARGRKRRAPPPPRLSYNQATAVLAMVASAAREAVEAAPSTSGSPPPPLSSRRAAAFAAASAVACRALTPAVRSLDLDGVIRLLDLLGHCARAGVLPDPTRVLWALQERCSAFASSPTEPLPPASTIAILRGCLALRWRPGMLLRELMLPLLRWLQSQGSGAAAWQAAAASGAAPDEGSPAAAPAAWTEGSPAAGIPRGRVGGDQAWTKYDVFTVLMLLAKLQYRGKVTSACIKYGMGFLLREGGPLRLSEQTSGLAAQGQAMVAAGAQLPAPEPRPHLSEDLTSMLWICVKLRYSGGTVLRPLMQQLMQVPVSQVSVRDAALALWAAERLGTAPKGLVRWALASCKNASKLAAAPPHSIMLVCWGLGRLGVKPPPAFVPAATVAMVTQLRAFSPRELSTVLFMLATWGASLRDDPAAGGSAVGTSVVRHLVATRQMYDGPSLCTAVWALQRLTSSPRDVAPGSGAATAATASTASVDFYLSDLPITALESFPASGTPPRTGASTSPLTPEALLALEDRLLEIWAASTDPRVDVAIPEHQLLRFLDACAYLGHRPDRLLELYLPSLYARLQALKLPPTGSADPASISRQIWAVAKAMATYGIRDKQLLKALERAALRCQVLLRPGHLVGLLNGMAALGHYPARWAPRGMLRRIRAAINEADAEEAGLVLQALAIWRQDMSESVVKLLEQEEADEVEVEAEALVSRGGNSAVQVQGHKRGAAATADEGAKEEEQGERLGASSAQDQRPGRLTQPTAARLESLRTLTLARMTELLLPPPPQQSAQASQSQEAAGAPALAPVLASPGSAAPAPSAAAALAAPAVPGTAAPPPARAPAAEQLSIFTTMRLLQGLAALGWEDDKLTAVLVRAAARLPAHPCAGVPELTTLLWALATLRVDAPELVDNVQAALMGLPLQRSLSAELSMMESGRLGSLIAAAPGTAQWAPTVVPAGGPASAGGSTGVTPAEAAAPAAQDPQPLPRSEAPSAETSVPTGGQGVDDVLDRRTETTASADSEGVGREPLASASLAVAAVAAPDSGDGSTGVNAPVELLSRPAKPAQLTADGAAGDAGAAAGSTSPAGAPGAGRFDTAAATAAAAAAVAQRYEEQLEGAAGRGPLPTEPWSPTDVFKTLWACAKMNRHPGPVILAACERSWLSLTSQAEQEAKGAATESPPTLSSLTGMLWALAVFRNHNGSLAQRLAAQLGERLRDGREAAAFAKQAVQVAACLLAAQADRSESPLNAELSAEDRAMLISAWRSKQAARVAGALSWYQEDLVSVLRKMGLRVAANVATPDGCVVVDVAVALMAPPQPQAQNGGPGSTPLPPRLLALELVGKHNSAINSPRIVGEAVIKYRLLQARGYLVVPIPCSEWDRIGHQDVWTKIVYLQAKIDKRTSGLPGQGAGSGAVQAPSGGAALVASGLPATGRAAPGTA